MGAQLIDGKATAAALRAEVAAAVHGLNAAHGLVPGLAVVLVGDNAASAAYVRIKSRETVAAGMRSKIVGFQIEMFAKSWVPAWP